MKKIFIISFCFVMAACSVERRHYTTGLNIQWKKQVKNTQTLASNTLEKKTQEPLSIEGFYANSLAVNPLHSSEISTAKIPSVKEIERKNEELAQKLFVSADKKAVLKEIAATNNITVSEKQLSRAERKLRFAEKLIAASPAAKSDGSKDQLVATLLCGFLGFLGVHRFYMGYTWQGVVQLLTAGGCGIWWLIDFIRILTGDLQPKDSNWGKSFDDY